ncbi:glutathione S-transferase family protein [Mesorhizobium sp. Z1-4]|uniref:glutathione S-transferase family protein n=1 Tax=Mesorhizobium sp. Z1-4 TaxID=2448478 RepID=UPI000FDA62D2|nr:glutathione S-transferase family protein [Mesorhizobium sp. Z1-4]
MLKFYHAPFTRALGVFWLLEELGVDYQRVAIDIRGGGAPEDYREVQPNKKVPAIEHDGTVITERAAITLYLAEIFTDAGLAPAVGDPARAAYLTWTVYNDAVFDPVLCARAHGLDYVSNDYPFGLYEDMFANLERHLSVNDFAAGDRFTAADTQLGTSIMVTMDTMKILPERPAFKAYVERLRQRPAYQRVSKLDYELAMALPSLET